MGVDPCWMYTINKMRLSKAVPLLAHPSKAEKNEESPTKPLIKLSDEIRFRRHVEAKNEEAKHAREAFHSASTLALL